MKQLTAEQIQENWNKLIQLIKDTFSEDYPDNRREKLLKMYHHFEDRMTVAPASGEDIRGMCLENAAAAGDLVRIFVYNTGDTV